ncbi:hypothetical protein M409DRAFT_60211 [Zasmidium cellare ATCC 36951]|uniref:Uncharacterized protein n=1 Tax=Zasmidium cellare ATCC 36951 TaxID=1080233 RepID=A0A6A6C1R7_ZASCE|nr:uncharacterized protein M409DRAFT_60211 [Zasmidium cellare ATCC 36951]KAF2160100.1 hypothetical protein M409DRAFT_60211 [Zasmidium cellare ATCC 36951]
MSPPRLRSTLQRRQRSSGCEGKTISSSNGNEEAAITRPTIRRHKRLKAEVLLKEEKNEVAVDKELGTTLHVSERATARLPQKHHDQTVPTPQFISFDSTAELMIHLSTRIIDLMNDRNYTSPFLSCLAPDIESPGSCGRSNVIQGFKKIAEALPNHRNKVQNVTCTVDEDTGTAKVVMTMRVSGFVYETIRQSSSLFTWVRETDGAVQSTVL